MNGPTTGACMNCTIPPRPPGPPVTADIGATGATEQRRTQLEATGTETNQLITGEEVPVESIIQKSEKEATTLEVKHTFKPKHRKVQQKE